LIVTSHILSELARICDTVAMITGGRLRAFGKLDDVMRQLCPTRSYEVQLVRDEQLDIASQLLKDLKVSETVFVSRQELTLRFPTAASENDLAKVLRRLIAADIRVSQFREVASDLEDAFLSVAAGAT
jgi:ABC-2 type transport system ATP-binding protein